MRGALALLAAAALVACTDPRIAELAGELAALQESRVARASFEKMHADVEASEAKLQATEAEIRDLGPELEAAQAEVSAAEAGFRRELDRNGVLNQEIQAGQERLQEGAARQAELEKEITIARARAQTFKDQAATFAKELRPDDPDWAVKLRIQSLREFLGEVGATWPRDPVLSEASKSALPADEREATRVGAEVAARIRDRVAEVFDLQAAGANVVETPAVASEPGAS